MARVTASPELRVLLSFPDPPPLPPLLQRCVVCQNLVEEGGAEMRYLLDASVLRLVCLALAYHSVNDDIGNASLGLLATMAANGGVEGQAYVESVMAIVTSVWQQFKDGPVGCGVLKWLALVAEDCTPGQTQGRARPPLLEALTQRVMGPVFGCVCRGDCVVEQWQAALSGGGGDGQHCPLP